MNDFAISAQLPPDLTPAVAYLRGEYSLWSYRIPYLSVVLPMSFVADKFSLVDEIPESERVEWTIDELFQRDISWERIDDELVKYLRNDSRPQFFNALTVALLPKEGHGLGSEYKEHETIEPILSEELDGPLQIGGIQIHSYSGSQGTAGKIRWDKNRTIAVAVDGQHRLAAIKKAKNHIPAERFNATKVPVILLIPDERIGYFEPEQPDSENRILGSLRRIFIDLNKHARSVSRSRNILLDDQDINDICTRSLLGKKLSLDTEAGRVPLALVDWVSEKNKIETGPFLTTVLLLNDLVRKVIGPIPEPEQERDPKIENWLKTAFEPSEDELEDLMTQVMRCFNREVPTTFKHSQLELLKTLFEDRWRALLYRILSEFSPYRELWDFGLDHKLHAPEFVNLYIAREILRGDYGEKRQEEIAASNQLHDADWSMSRSYLNPLKKIDEEFKENSWAFKVVFQRALFSSFLDLVNQRSEFSQEFDGENGRDEFLTMWIEALGAFCDSGLISTNIKVGGEDFWEGIGKSAGGTIEYTKVGSDRIQKWLDAWVCAYWSDREALPTYKQLQESDAGLLQMCKKSLAHVQVKKGMQKLLVARNTEYESDDQWDEEIAGLIKARYEKMRKMLRTI